VVRRRGAIFLLALLLSVGVNAQFLRDFAGLSEEVFSSPTGRAFLQAYGALKAGYLNETDDEVLLQGAIEGMVGALEDPYTSYATPEQAAQDAENRSGSFEGIGAVLQPRNRATDTVVEVINVYSGSPAEEAGVQVGDIFVEVDGVDVQEATTQEIVRMVRGPAGSEVRLGFRRPGVEGIVYITVTRGSIAIIDVESTVLEGGVGYISISSFANERVHSQLTEQLEALKARGITSLILDLRNNGGGLLDQGVRVADEFLSEGDIVYQRARGVTQRLATADPDWFDLPMVVLVNRNSASASEIVAGALQDNGRAKVIGEETFGKGVGQSVVSLNNGGQLVYLSFEWLTPSRRSINEQGITPDVLLEDALLSDVLTLQGQGARPGQTIEIVVDGEVIGTADIDDEGNFTFFQPFNNRPDSAVQGEALVDLEIDTILRRAHQELLTLQAQAQ
jgi:carboxyl-terminal processing protease